MDFSKLSDEDLLALKSGDYSKVSNEGLLTLKGTPSEEKPSLLRKTTQAITTPIRGFRGLGVMAQKAIEGAPIEEVASRGAEAVKPGFEPKSGEKIGAAVGSSAPFLPLAAIGGVPAALIAGGSNVAEQFSEKGKVEPVEAAASTLLGGLSGPSARAVPKLSKLVTTPSLSKIGKTIETINKAKGLALEGEAINAPRTRKAIINWTRSLSKVDPKRVDPKSINFFKEETGNILDFLKVAKQGAQPKQLVAKGTVARLSKIKDKLTKALIEEVPELKKPYEQYGVAKSRGEIVSQLGSAVPSFIKGPAKAVKALGSYLNK